MQVNGIAGPTTSAAGGSAARLAENFDAFLKLLTAQLQNQDPLEPMDSSEFTQQLVQFSGVEQSIHTNKNLETLIGLTYAQSATNAVGYLGRTVTVAGGRAALSNGTAGWDYILPQAAAVTIFTVTDATGRVVYTGAGNKSAGAHRFVWDGRDNRGTKLPDGTYTLTVTARAADGTAIPASVSSRGRVDEIELSGTEPILRIGPMAVGLYEVAAVTAE